MTAEGAARLVEDERDVEQTKPEPDLVEAAFGKAGTKDAAQGVKITFTGQEGTQIEYKYALGSWDYVEKDGSCGETANRQLTLSYGATGTQVVNDTVPNWRNVAPCGN